MTSYDSYAKLFSSILDSTIWSEDSDTRIVWITLMAMADARGYVGATIPGVARRAGVNLDKCEAAITRFMSPDKYSRTPDLEGRRLVKADGGFLLINYRKYRDLRNQDERREYQAEWARNNRRHLSTRSTQAEAEAEAEAEAGDPPINPPRRRGRPKAPGLCPFPTGWRPTEAHAKRARDTQLDLTMESERFEAHHTAKGSRFACWNSAFTTWLMNAVRYRDERATAQRRSPNLFDELEQRRQRQLEQEGDDDETP